MKPTRLASSKGIAESSWANDMQIRFPSSPAVNWRVVMSRLGYHEQYDRRSQQFSYAKRLRSLPYPRFHAYIETGGVDVVINLHLDEKAASYAGQTRHSGDYDGELVVKEAGRIKSYVNENG